MTALRRAAIYKLAKAAREIELEVMEGELHQDANGRWHVGHYDLSTWLGSHAGQQMILALGPLADERPLLTRTCRTCGRDYTELECPTCRENRLRLRGHA